MQKFWWILFQNSSKLLHSISLKKFQAKTLNPISFPLTKLVGLARNFPDLSVPSRSRKLRLRAIYTWERLRGREINRDENRCPFSHECMSPPLVGDSRLCSREGSFSWCCSPLTGILFTSREYCQWASDATRTFANTPCPSSGRTFFIPCATFHDSATWTRHCSSRKFNSGRDSWQSRRGRSRFPEIGVRWWYLILWLSIVDFARHPTQVHSCEKIPR